MFGHFKSILLFSLVVSFLPVISVAQTAQCGMAVPGQPLPDLIVDSLRLKLDTIVTTEKLRPKTAQSLKAAYPAKVITNYSASRPLHRMWGKAPCDR